MLEVFKNPLWWKTCGGEFSRSRCLMNRKMQKSYVAEFIDGKEWTLDIFSLSPNGVCNVNCLERWISERTSRNCAMIHVDLDISGCHNLMNRSEKVEQLFSTSYLIRNLLSAISQLELSGSLQSAFCTSCSVRRYFWTPYISSST